MRAALPHLRLLTLNSDQLWSLSEFLLPEEKHFLAVKKVFREESFSSPPSLSTVEFRREFCTAKPLVHELVLIPEGLIKGSKKVEQLFNCSGLDLAFCLRVHICQRFCLTGIEILTRAKRCKIFLEMLIIEPFLTNRQFWQRP